MRFHWRRWCDEQGLEETAWVPLAEHAEAAERFMAWRVEKAPPARATPEQVQRVNAMDEERPWFRFVWKRFCVERAFRVTNPEGLPSDLVEEFLEQYEGGWTDPPVLATDREAADLTARIAGAAEWEWRQYCYKHTYGVRDPRFLPSEVAQRAIREFHPGFSKISSTGPKPAGVATNPRAALFDKVSEVLRRPPTKEELAYDQVQDKGKFVATVQVTEAARGGSGTASFRGEAARTSVLACRSAALAALRAFFPKAVEMFEGLAPERTKEAHEWRMKSVLNYGKPGDQAEFASGEKVEKRAGKAGDDASEGDQALAELRQLFQDDTTIRWQWLDWCRQKDMSGTTLQDRHAGAAREFLDTRKLLPPVQLATPQEVLKLNSLRFRKEFGPATTWLWAKFCSLSAYGDCSGMEPKELPSALVNQFLDFCESGAEPMPEMASGEALEGLQALRQSTSEERWSKFCRKYSYGVEDPAYVPLEVAQRMLREWNVNVARLRAANKASTSPRKQRKMAGRAEKQQLPAPVKQLHEVVKGILEREPTSEDIVYEASQHGDPMGPYMATVALRGAEEAGLDAVFEGAPRPSFEEALASAAKKALAAIRERGLA